MVWKKGESGNPTGKPAGTRNKATLMIQRIMERGAQEIAEAVVGLAKEGDLSGIMEQPPHPSAGFGDAAAPVLSGELIL